VFVYSAINLKGISLGPDIYQFDAGSKPMSKLEGPPDDITLFPTTFVAAQGEKGSFLFNGNTTLMQVRNGQETIPIDALSEPSLNVIASATSANQGELGSPTLFGNLIENILENRFNLTGIRLFAFKQAVGNCLPLVRKFNPYHTTCPIV